MSAYGETLLEAPVRMVCKDWGLSLRSPKVIPGPPASIRPGVGAAEQKRPKARVAKTERMKERIVRG